MRATCTNVVQGPFTHGSLTILSHHMNAVPGRFLHGSVCLNCTYTVLGMTQRQAQV